MLIHLKLFAALREELGQSDERLELPGEIATVGAARTFLGKRSERWQRALSAPRTRAALNQRIADDSVLLEEGAELAFFPPVTGG